jgi:hypothetical protein
MEKLLWLSLEPNRYNGSGPFSLYCVGAFDITISEYREIKLAYRQGAMKRSMPIHENAVQLCDRVKERAELWLTTTRPYLSLDGVIKDTTFWLDHHGIRYDGLLFDDDKYEVLADRVDTQRVVAVLDDIDEMCDAASSVMWYGRDVSILYANKYNAAMWPDFPNRIAHGAFNAWGMIAERIDSWEEVHASAWPSRA